METFYRPILSFKSFYESLDFWMEWIQEGAVFFPKNIQAQLDSTLGKEQWNYKHNDESYAFIYGAVLNSFHPEVKYFIRTFERIKNKIGRYKVDVQFN